MQSYTFGQNHNNHNQHNNGDDNPNRDNISVAVVTTGGTIVSAYDHLSGAIIPQEQIMQELLVLLSESHTDDKLHYDIYQLFNLDSSQITFDNLHKLADLVASLLKQSQYKAIIITHGTDTMEESAFFVQIVLQPSIPIIFTGAMYPSDDPHSDGLTNLMSSFTDAHALSSGVWVRMGEQLVPALGCYKKSVGFDVYPRALSIDDWLRIVAQYVSLTDKLTKILEKSPCSSIQVPLITSYLGDEGEVLVQLAPKSQAVVIEALGSGNLTYACERAVIEANTHIPIVITSRVWAARIVPHYSSGAHLAHADIVFCDSLPPVQLRLLLYILIAAEIPETIIRAILLEISVVSSSLDD